MKTTKTTKKMVLTFSLLLILLSTQPSLKLAKAQDSSEKTYNALFLVSTGYGDNYYDLVGNFSQWGWNIETAGRTSVVMGCSNHHPAYTLICNLTFDDLDRSKIREYDCLIIPSGGHWLSLVNTRSVETILNRAYENGLILGTLCIGQQVFARAEGLMDGVDVAYFSMTRIEMDLANANIIHEDVVSDKRIVTGGGGGGLDGGGYTVAPTAEFCEAVKIAIQTRNSNRIIYSVTGSIGGALLLSIGIFVVKKRNTIFSKSHKKTQQVKE
jgi:putative intracellular protease/amidase